MCARCWVFCPENAIYIEGYPIERHYAGIDEGYKPPKVGNLGWNNGGT
jgi:ferredoxin